MTDTPMRANNMTRRLFEKLVNNPQSDGGLSDAQARHEPANFLRHAASISMSKIADGLIDPKLVLSWLLTHLGASSFFVGLLVPIREAGALLPQLFTAPRVQAMERRKWAWVAGAAGQGAAAAGIVLTALTLEGSAAGIVICALLAVLAVSRSVCSVSYSDILGKTVGQSRRGSATGLASSLGAGAVVIFALLLMTGLLERATLVIAAIALAAALFFAASTLFSTLWEEAAVGETGTAALEQLKILRTDAQLRRFIWARGLLTSTALAPPYIVLLGAQAGQGTFDRLGALVLASSIASLISSWLWGRLADRSSRKVLMFSAVAGTLALLAAVLLDLVGMSGTLWALPLVLFVLMIAYHGVRQGRSIYLVDMAPEGSRATYTAVSNTVIGVLLLGSGIFGALASLAGAKVTLLIFAAMSFAAIVVAKGLKEVGD
ncbi:MFS transporter [Sulfitobacter sp. F26169L]|uniref:MFS transporter n=1 Tax=Sulfitobacter sp. F26169L TaxID=2996015 RepID=UPI002260CE58|nr:MFS transporter [Sulfitobacter sp. F26169L]MCX7567377.1 MFS transporter [Sulfitobacter sp. F26169L]